MNNCVIGWFTSWPEEALLFVCTVFLADMDIQEDSHFRPYCDGAYVSVQVEHQVHIADATHQLCHT